MDDREAIRVGEKLADKALELRKVSRNSDPVKELILAICNTLSSEEILSVSKEFGIAIRLAEQRERIIKGKKTKPKRPSLNMDEDYDY